MDTALAARAVPAKGIAAEAARTCLREMRIETPKGCRRS
jgi:hypothetical protein